MKLIEQANAREELKKKFGDKFKMIQQKRQEQMEKLNNTNAQTQANW